MTEPWRGRITRPPPVGWLAVIGYGTAPLVGVSALGVASFLYEGLAGEPALLLAAAACGLILWASAWLNRRAVAWWVRRQPPEPPDPRRA